MTDPKFTPGPWRYRPHDFDDWGVVKADKFTICQARDERQLDQDALNLHRKAGTDPWEANARLIAAAPDLYDALLKSNELLAVLFAHGDNSAQQVLIRNANALGKARGDFSQ